MVKDPQEDAELSKLLKETSKYSNFGSYNYCELSKHSGRVRRLGIYRRWHAALE